jgi:hypothetical protein
MTLPLTGVLYGRQEGNALAFMKEYKDTAYTEANYKLYTVGIFCHKA